MKHTTDDGSEFEDLQEAKEHEKFLQAIKDRTSDIEQHLEWLGREGRDVNKRNATIITRVITDWETWKLTLEAPRAASESGLTSER